MDYNTIQANNYAHSLGLEQELEMELERISDLLMDDLPNWIKENNPTLVYAAVTQEAMRIQKDNILINQAEAYE